MTIENYQHILATVDFSGISSQVAQRAKALASHHHAKLSIIHVLENLPVMPDMYGDISLAIIDTEQWEEIRQSAIEHLDKFALDENLPDNTHKAVLTGTPKQEITQYAEDHQADLIIIGSHGHRGLLAMLGSTADGVIHRANCDVMVLKSTK